MMSSFYKPGGSVLHRFDPRAKLLLLLLLVVVFFLPLVLVHLSLYLVFLAGLCLVFLGVKELLRPLRLILPILVLVMLLTPPFYRQGEPLLSIRGLLLLSDQGLAESLRLVVRFTGISLLFYLFLRSTDPDCLVLSLRWFGLPFSVAMVISIAFEYLPYFGTLYDQVRGAHLLRQAAAPAGGQEPSGSRRSRAEGRGRARGRSRHSFFARLSEAVPVLTSVLIISVRRIPALAMALESRGLGRKNRRSSYRRLKSGRPLAGDGLIMLALAAAIVASILVFP